MQDFNYLVESVDVDIIREIASLNIESEDKKTLIAYSIARKLEGVTLYLPKKTHRTMYAKILAKYSFDTRSIQKLALVGRSFAYQIKKEIHDC